MGGGVNLVSMGDKVKNFPAHFARHQILPIPGVLSNKYDELKRIF